jgi:AcrR family transcriptional regulator
MFREEGFERTGLRDIAKACDMLPGSLHYRYRAKEDILIDMMRLAIERTIRAIVDATITVQDPLQKLRAALQAHVGVLMSGDDMVYVLLFEWRSVRGEARELIIAERDRYERYWATMLDAMKVQGYIRPEVDIELTRLIGLGAINWVATWYKRGGRYNLEQVGEAIWQMLAGGVLAQRYQAEAARL